MIIDPVLGVVERLARALPGVPRLRILDAVEAERERLQAETEPWLEPFVAPAALQRLRAEASWAADVLQLAVPTTMSRRGAA